MSKRAWMLMLALGLGLAMPGCGDDDSGGEEDGSNNAGTGSNAGRGGSSAGRGGSSAGSGSSSDPGSIAECMAQEMMGGGGTTDCEGVEEYSACVQEMCGVGDCMNGACADYFDCAQDAADPCNPTGCTPSSACGSCLANVGTCSLNNCFELIMCGETTAGGACDQLDDCCADQPESMRMICLQAASGARAGGGDMLCMTVMDAFCM